MEARYPDKLLPIKFGNMGVTPVSLIAPRTRIIDRLPSSKELKAPGSCSQRAFYSELTDPNLHQPNNFCYIIHALNPDAGSDLLSYAGMQNGYDASQHINLLREPHRISEKQLISASIISQDLIDTWGRVFFMLSVPWNNFLSLTPFDNDTNVGRADDYIAHAKPLMVTPRVLIKNTIENNADRFDEGVYTGNGFNEALLTGARHEKRVSIIGVGIIHTDYGDRVDTPKEAQRIREIAQELDVPSIEFIRSSWIKDSAPEIYDNMGIGPKTVIGIYINRGGFRYMFTGNWDVSRLEKVCKSDKNRMAGHNPVSCGEWMSFREEIAQCLSTDLELDFLRQLDEYFGRQEPGSETALIE